MYVISSSPSSQNREPQIASDPNQVSIKLLLQLNRNPVEPSLRAENAMYKVRSMRMRHSATLNLN
jgi:hypothetical protein